MNIEGQVAGLWQSSGNDGGPLWRQPGYVRPVAALSELRTVRYGPEAWKRHASSVRSDARGSGSSDLTDLFEGMRPQGWGVAEAWHAFSGNSRYARLAASFAN